MYFEQKGYQPAWAVKWNQYIFKYACLYFEELRHDVMLKFMVKSVLCAEFYQQVLKVNPSPAEP